MIWLTLLLFSVFPGKSTKTFPTKTIPGISPVPSAGGESRNYRKLVAFPMSKNSTRFCVVDAFTGEAFKGNPAVVCLLEDVKDDRWLQSVATEFNIPTTAYLTPISESSESTSPRFAIRWFTPVAEVQLCGHATLAASHFLFSYGLVKSDIIEFSSHSGVLTAKKLLKSVTSGAVNDLNNTSNGHGDDQDDYFIELDFPVVHIAECHSADVSQISKSLNGASIVEVQKTTTAEDLFVRFINHVLIAKVVAEIQPEFDEVKRCPGRGIIITGPAPSESGFDFYSRFFCPKFGVNEDPVCGSAHCAIAPYWSKKLGKIDFVAYQASARGGVIDIHLDTNNQRVFLRGQAVIVSEGSILV
ncbi:OLC1v1007361C5 [Oldenlandia corymbosa var. corymbosa]|uniref:OLC1v1007361C5 n=1 Tax=Oldenlandia corymbosa var. corymbosa TaxID=529605 RepID=A0AAV1DJP1_OLDCO|nr:OLC1v1007361C5 [Oldenlandia corymbosa var. corymbosa]